MFRETSDEEIAAPGVSGAVHLRLSRERGILLLDDAEQERARYLRGDAAHMGGETYFLARVREYRRFLATAGSRENPDRPTYSREETNRKREHEAAVAIQLGSLNRHHALRLVDAEVIRYADYDADHLRRPVGIAQPPFVTELGERLLAYVEAGLPDWARGAP